MSNPHQSPDPPEKYPYIPLPEWLAMNPIEEEGPNPFYVSVSTLGQDLADLGFMYGTAKA